MAGLLTTSSIMQCPQGGMVNVISSDTRVQAVSSFVLRSSDTFTIAACPFNPGIAHPCVLVQWVQPSLKSQAMDDFILTEESVGLCVAADMAAQTGYEAHVEQMIRQVLLTSPGERTDLPEFGCGLRQLIFAPLSDALTATTQMLVQQALDQWLGGQIQVQNVIVVSPEQAPVEGELLIQIDYVLIETLSNKHMEIRVL